MVGTHAPVQEASSIPMLKLKIYGTETAYAGKMAIASEGPKIMEPRIRSECLRFRHPASLLPFRSPSLVSRVGHETLEAIPPTRQSYA